MDAEHSREATDLLRLSALADPVRRQLYEHVAAQHKPVRRDDAAQAAGISRTLAAYHLDRLADAGLLATSYARPEGQAGPGAGRPAKLYQRVNDEVSVSVPPRTYALLAQLLADAMAGDDSGPLYTALTATAEEEGRHAAQPGTDLFETLRRRGYEPVVGASGGIDLHNCPFHQLAQRHTKLVCGLNHALLRGLLAGRGDDPDRAELAPLAGHCCVTIRPTAAAKPGRDAGPRAAATSGTSDRKDRSCSSSSG